MFTRVLTLELYTFWFLRSFLAFFIPRNLARCARAAVSSASSCRQQPLQFVPQRLANLRAETKYEKADDLR